MSCLETRDFHLDSLAGQPDPVLRGRKSAVFGAKNMLYRGGRSDGRFIFLFHGIKKLKKYGWKNRDDATAWQAEVMGMSYRLVKHELDLILVKEPSDEAGFRSWFAEHSGIGNCAPRCRAPR